MAKKLLRSRRPRLTHVEVRRGSALRLRISISDDALADAAGELGKLVKKAAPTATTRIASAIEVVEAPQPLEIVVAPLHESDDDEYHAGLRARLAEMFGSLCDSALDDALALGRAEQARRMEGGN